MCRSVFRHSRPAARAMHTMSSSNEPPLGRNTHALQLGFISDADCAPIVYAQESGLFEKYEVQVELHRETRWASIRDKIIHGDLDCAQAPATLPFITNIGLESDHCACVSGLVISLQGNAIVVSRELADLGAFDAATLREVIYRHWGRRTFTLGVVFPHSPAFLLLRNWLAAGGIMPGIEIRIVVVPPAQLFPMLKLGYIDGFCGGEPWTTLALESGAGQCLIKGGELVPLHPEKVLMVRRDFAEERAEEHERVIAALLEACAFCDQPGSHPLLSQMLSRVEYVNTPPECLLRGLAGAGGTKRSPAEAPLGVSIFNRFQANDPSDAKASWLVERLYELMEENVLHAPKLLRLPVIRNVFRRDIYQRARERMRGEFSTLSNEVDHFSNADAPSS